MSVTFEEVEQFAIEQFEKAKTSAKIIKFAALSQARSEVLTERYGRVTAKALGDDPDFELIENGYGKSVWAVLLSVDLRRSSSREVKIGPRKTHLTMHTYLPTVIKIVGHWNGTVVGLRGDGLIAQFGETEIVKNDGTDVDTERASKAAQDAVCCGKSMVEAVQEIINPLLVKNDIDGDLSVGVGIDQGVVVVTRIGYLTASELTAYGPAVNHACKYSDRSNQIRISNNVKAIFPEGKNGRIKFFPAGAGSTGLIVDFPSDIFMLDRQRINKPR